MDPIAIASAPRRAQEQPTAERAKAEQVAGTFEEMFVRTLVSSLRQTSNLGGGAGMFGDGPGADTYADWFDQNVAEQVAKNGRIGIKQKVLTDMERHGEIDGPAAATKATSAADLAAAAVAAASRSQLNVARAIGKGGLDVLH